MYCSIPYFELDLMVESSKFEKIITKASRNAEWKERPIKESYFGYVDDSYKKKGYVITYHDKPKKKKINISVCPALAIDDDSSSDLWKPSSEKLTKLLKGLDNFVDGYFRPHYDLNDFSLASIDFAVDIDVGSRNAVADYIKVLHNIGKVKCFSRLKHSKRGRIKKEECFALKGNSNGIEFHVYGSAYNKKHLRVHVRLTEKAAIKGCLENDYNIAGQIFELTGKCGPILMEAFQHIVPRGDYYKKDKSMQLIRERVKEQKMMHKMMRLVYLIPEKKSLHLAQKAMSYRKIDRLMAAFAEIEVSPVTISKRHKLKKLNSLYDYLEREC